MLEARVSRVYDVPFCMHAYYIPEQNNTYMVLWYKDSTELHSSRAIGRLFDMKPLRKLSTALRLRFEYVTGFMIRKQQVTLIQTFAKKAFKGESLVAQMIMGRLAV